MKLYKRKDFIKLPANTIYSRVDNNVSELCFGLFCKTSGSDWEVDWIEQDLIAEGKAHSELTCAMDQFTCVLNKRDNFESFELDYDSAGRDGLFEDKDTFVVWDTKDIKKLIGYLEKCI